MITFESVGDYPNGYSLTSDEMHCIHQLMAEDPSRNYAVREVGEGQAYHLEVTATYPDSETPIGPRWSIKEGATTRLPIWEDEALKDHRKLLLNAADLLSDSGENAEYDRAIVELTAAVVGVAPDEYEALAIVLGGLKQR